MAKILALLWFVFPVSATALEFTHPLGDLTLSGEVRDGDAERFWNVLQLEIAGSPNSVVTIHLGEMPGGNVSESMRIGTMIRETYSRVWANSNCFSSCVFIFMAGIERHVTLGSIGVHRAFIAPQANKDLSLAESRQVFAQIQESVRGYLKTMGSSSEFFDMMIDGSSSEIAILSRSEISSMIGSSDPAVDEWLVSKCGALSKVDEDYLGVISRWGIHLAYADSGADELYPNIADEILSLHPFTLERAFEAKFKIEQCKENALVTQRNEKLGVPSTR